MSGKAIWKLHSDPEFQRLAMPLPEAEYRALEEDILSNQRGEPVAVWHRTILEGYARYQIYTHHAIKFGLEETVFPSKADAMLWVCERQLRRLSITEAAKRYLIGRIYSITKAKCPEIKYTELYMQIADKFGISPVRVRDYRGYANHLDFLRQKEPELVEGILSGKYLINPHKLKGIKRRSSQEIWSMVQQADETGRPSPRTHTVKDMPCFDPDGPLMSLALTIPSWIRIMEQAPLMPGCSAASPECRQKLEQALLSLYETAEKTLLGIWED